jgi:hypothetical protein
MRPEGLAVYGKDPSKQSQGWRLLNGQPAGVRMALPPENWQREELRLFGRQQAVRQQAVRQQAVRQQAVRQQAAR